MSDYFHAYSGSEPYIFVSYSHKDSARVYPILSQLHGEGYRIWYDEGIPPTEEWRGVINEHIRDCGVFMVFVTGESMSSHEVIKECTYAINLRKKLHIIYLEKVPDSRINANLIADFTNSQRVHAHELHSSVFSIKLREPLEAFRDANAETDTGAQTETVTDRAVKADTGRERMSIQQLWNESMKKKTPVWLAAVFAAAVAVVVTWWCAVVLREETEFDYYLLAFALVVVPPCAFLISAAVLLFYNARKDRTSSYAQLRKDVRMSKILASVCSLLIAPGTFVLLGGWNIDAFSILAVVAAVLLSFVVVIAGWPIYKAAEPTTTGNISISKIRGTCILLRCGLIILEIGSLLVFGISLYSLAQDWDSSYRLLLLTSVESLIALLIHHSYYISLLDFGKKVSDIVPEN